MSTECVFDNMGTGFSSGAQGPGRSTEIVKFERIPYDFLTADV